MVETPGLVNTEPDKVVKAAPTLERTDKAPEDVTEDTLVCVFDKIFRMLEAVASEDDPVLDAVTVKSEVSSDKLEKVDTKVSTTQVGRALPAAVLDALIAREAVLAARAEATSPAKVPTAEDAVAEESWDIEKKEAREDTSVRVDVAALKDTPVAPAPIFPRAVESADVTNALISAVEEVVESGATSSTPTIPAPTYPYLSSTNAMMVANPP